MTDTDVRLAQPSKLWGLAGEFSEVDRFLGAVEEVRKAGYVYFDAHSPIPVHGLDEAMEIRPSRLPKAVFVAGLLGCLGGLGLQWWTNAIDYPFRISGKPLFALPPAIPVVFELTVLFSAVSAVLLLFVANRQPELYHPLFAFPAFAGSTNDRFFVVIEARDPKFDEKAAKDLLLQAGAVAVHSVEVA